MNSIENRINALKNDFTSGSTDIIISAVEIFSDAISSYGNNVLKVRDAAKRIVEVKPAMAGLENIIGCYLSEYESGTAYKKVIIERIKLARKKTIESASCALLQSRNKKLIITTCSYSSAVVDFFKAARNKATDFSVKAVQSKWNENNYGNNLTGRLKGLGINSTVIPDSEIEVAIINTDFIIIGADSFTPDGEVVNGIPSAELAMKAYGKCPSYVLAESFKRNDNLIIDDGFEKIDAELINKIFTDDLF